MLERMESFFESRIGDYDRHMLTTIEGAREFYPFTASLLPGKKGASVLDLGCGTGLELECYFRMNESAAVTGIDLSRAMLNRLKEKFPDKKLHLIHGSYFDVFLGESLYDAAVSVESLHHFTAEKKKSLYCMLHNALKHNGYFVLTDYFAESEASEKEYFAQLERSKQEQGITDNALYHYDTPLTVGHEIDILTAAGFSEVRIMRSWSATYTLFAKR